ncbi:MULTISPECIES: hypothetical protein [unclassified Mycoplasma]|uniref:hypothetical protein n=1 Tax=unclassified Mycoplasma TaxID=2683645 RepID=UPI00211C5130|nr:MULTISPECIES: hypothetical protein [unclassified Mycoplasma]UUM20132.1 hypothetical protein NPA11_01765 [Mycoplasma sp. 1578d]UUM25112.1 hypothetical protein NPA12_01740 [Mycoplasma sp. 3686d]
MKIIKKIFISLSLMGPIGLISCGYENVSKNDQNPSESAQDPNPELQKEQSPSNPDSDPSKTSEPDQETNYPKLELSTVNKNTYLENNDEYIQAIKNRTFYLWETSESKKESTLHNDGANIWLLDYARISKNKFKLFFGSSYTNASRFFSEDDYNYYQQTDRLNQYTPISFTLGWSEDAYDPSPTAKIGKWIEKKFLIKEKSVMIRNFMLQRDIVQNGNYPKNINFAVVEMDIDLDQLSKNDNDLKLRAKIISAINEVNKSIIRFKQADAQHEYLFNDKSVPYATLDYSSVQNLNHLSKQTDKLEIDRIIKEYFEKEKYTLAPEFVYNFGYTNPIRSQIVNVNNVSESEKDKLGPSKEVGDLKFEIWGGSDYSYSLFIQNHSDDISLGSLVVNEQGLPIGVVSGKRTEGQKLWDDKFKLKIQIQPFTLKFETSKNLPNREYDLINENYRKTLVSVYGKHYKTAIFGGELADLK